MRIDLEKNNLRTEIGSAIGNISLKITIIFQQDRNALTISKPNTKTSTINSK